MGKQYTTAPILVNSNGDPIPQYLDITDKTDSPQGTFKPLTNETIQKVQLTGSNSTKIENTEDSPVPVQLTGSNVGRQFVRSAAQFAQSKPDGQEGDRLWIWDDRIAYLHDGTDWRKV